MNDHDNFFNYLVQRFSISFNGSIELAKSGLNISLFLNGTALISILALLGSLATNSELLSEADSFLPTLLPFFFGVLATALASFLAYFHQSLVEQEDNKKINDWVGNKTRKIPNFRTKTGMSKLGSAAAFLIFSSYLLFGFGSLNFYLALRSIY